MLCWKQWVCNLNVVSSSLHVLASHETTRSMKNSRHSQSGVNSSEKPFRKTLFPSFFCDASIPDLGPLKTYTCSDYVVLMYGLRFMRSGWCEISQTRALFFQESHLFFRVGRLSKTYALGNYMCTQNTLCSVIHSPLDSTQDGPDYETGPEETGKERASQRFKGRAPWGPQNEKQN